MKGLGAIHNARQHRACVLVLFSFGKGGRGLHRALFGEFSPCPPGLPRGALATEDRVRAAFHRDEPCALTPPTGGYEGPPPRPGRSRDRPPPDATPDSEVPASAGLEGGLRGSRGRLEGSFEASAVLRRLRIRVRVGHPSSTRPGPDTPPGDNGHHRDARDAKTRKPRVAARLPPIAQDGPSSARGAPRLAASTARRDQAASPASAWATSPSTSFQVLVFE